MKKNSKKNKKNNERTQEQERNEKFSIISNRIAYYYKEVFNIEIISLFYKKEIAENFRYNTNDYELDKLRELVFVFYVLIKDCNKKIFKYKLIKCCSNASNYLANKEDFHFVDSLYEFVDKGLGEYCKEKYMNDNIPRERILKFLKKDKEINEDYKKWKIENYK